jgi:hypothetical protein
MNMQAGAQYSMWWLDPWLDGVGIVSNFDWSKCHKQVVNMNIFFFDSRLHFPPFKKIEPAGPSRQNLLEIDGSTNNSERSRLTNFFNPKKLTEELAINTVLYYCSRRVS